MRIVFAWVLISAATVHAEPCPVFGLGSKVVLENPAVTSDGGIVVGELPEPNMGAGVATPDRSAWRIRTAGKLAAVKPDVIAPGLVVYRPPAGAAAFDLVDGKAKVLARAKLATTAPALLEAPRVKTIVSGQSRAKHVSTFVTVELDGAAAPKQAIALVVAELKGPARSWGRTFAGMTTINVYSTGGGCVTMFPDGTVVSQPGDKLVAFWVDANGRRSPMTPPIIVAKSP